MGKKLLCLIMAVCFVLGLTACGNSSVAMDNSQRVDNTTVHGGFVAETGDYVYFINGVEKYVTEYKTGDVTKGALARIKKSDIGTDKFETVVSKLIVADDTDAGIYIYGDYVYYAVPSEEKDKTGTVKNDQLNFFRTKLDGSDTSKNIPARDFPHSAKYRYVQSGNNVYLVVHSTELYVYDAVAGKQLYTTENEDVLAKIDVAELLFSEDSANVYFTSLPVNTVLSDKDNVQKDAHHVVYQVALSSASAKAEVKIVLDGVGKKNVVNDEVANPEGVDLVGVTIDLIRNVGGKLYFASTSLNTASGTTPKYLAVAESKLDGSIAKSWLTDENTLTVDKDYASAIFADTSIFHDGKIYFVNASHGLMVYDSAKVDDVTTVVGVSRVYYSDTAKGATLDFISKEDVDYMYFHDASGNYYKLNLATPEEELRLNTHAVNTTWYTPEVITVNGEYFLIVAYTDSKFKSYCQAINTTKLAKAYAELTEDEDKTAFYEVEPEKDDESAESESEEEVVVRATDFSVLFGTYAEADVEEESNK